MKTKLTTIFKKSANTPPMWVCLLFALVFSTNCWADPIAIGTGTVTLNKGNTSDPSPITNTIVLPQLSNEECITFGYYGGGNDAYTGGWAYPNGIEWSVTLLQGVYDIEVTYGTGAYGTRPFFDLYDGNTPVKEVFHAPSDQTSKNNPGKAGFTGSNTIDLSTITEGKTYTLKASDGWGGAYGTCIGHISFTRKEGVSLTVFGQETDGGATTLPSNGSNTINNVTVSTNMTIDFCNNRTYDYIFGADYTDYVDIAVDNSLKITGLATSVMYDGSGSGKLYIQFCSTTSYDPDHKVGEAIELSGHTDGGPFYTYPPTPTSVSIPNGTIKSARIYRVGTRQYGIRLYRIAVATTEDVCASPLTATFSAIEVEVTGDAPANISECLGNYFEIPNANTLRYAGHKFTGWKLNNTGDLITAGTSYEMPAGGASFVAQWESFTVPTVTNLAVTEPVGQTVPLSWIIPGICDLSSPVVPKYQNNCTLLTKVYYPEGDSVGVAGNTTTDNQFGVAFEIPSTTTNLEWISFEYKGNFASNAHLWAGACDAASGANAYWEFEGNMSVRPTNASEFVQSKQFTPNRAYWDGAWVNNPISDRYLSQIAIYGNTSGSGIDGLKYAIRNVRYHCTTFDVDIDHIVLVRKEGGAPANPTDGTVLYSGTKSHFVDDSDAKEFGHTYYYRVFAFHEDGTYSASTAISHEIESVATCTVSFNIGEGAIGDAPAAITDKPANGTVTLPSIGSAYKPFYAFTGWKKNNAGDLLAAGSPYTVTAADVEAGTISFTAQWVEDNTTRRIPAEHILNYSNQSTSVATTDSWDVTNDGINDVCLDMRQKTAEWRVFIKPGYYDISTICAVPSWGISYRLSIVDPVTDLQVKELFYEHTDGDKDHAIIRNLSKRFDLTDLVYGKQYIIRIKDTWTGCNLLVHDININPVTPEEIASETVLDAGNTVTTGLTEVTDVDFPGDNDQSVNLYNKKMDWVVKIAKGYYNISLLYGAPQYSTRVSVALIDPEGVEPTRWFCPDQADRNGHYYHTSGTEGTQYYSIGLDKRDLYDIDPEKTYIVRVHDENGSSNSLRVKDLTFTPVTPVEIHEEATLNASNVMVAPSIVDSRIDISNQKEAVWYATIDPHKFDITLTYFAEDGGTKVRFAIIPVGGDTIFVHQENKYEASNTTYTIPALDQDLTNISSGVYKIIVKDNYKLNGSKPQIISLTFSRSVTTHTRSGLRVGDFGTICLPYAVAAEDRNGADLFEIDVWDPNGASLTLSQLNEDENMVAGRPYIFKATAATATFRYYAEGDEAEAGSNNGLVGSYVQALIPQNGDNYIIYNNKLYLVNSEAYVGVNRAYIHKQDQVQPAPAYRRRVTLSVNGAQVATDIDLTNDPAQMTKYIENGHLFIFRDGKLYNAQGQLVK